MRMLTFLSVLVTSLVLQVPAASAAVMVDDTPATSWRVNGRVYATVIVGDTVVVGGQFTSVLAPDGTAVARKNLAAFSLSTGEYIPSWAAAPRASESGAGGVVRALATDGTSIYVGGAFAKVAGTPGARIAKLDAATGRPQPFAAGVDNVVRALTVSEGQLYVGGQFLNANGQVRTRLAKFDATTGVLDGSFRASASHPVWGLVKHPQNDVLYASGQFTTLSGQPRNGVGAVSASTGAVRPTIFGSAAKPTLGLAINEDGSRLFGAGGSGSNAAAAWDTTTGTRVWRQVTDGDIQAVAYHAGTVYFGFHDGYRQDTTLKMLAANATTGALQSFYPRFDSFWGVFAIAVTDAGVVAGGEFTNVSGVAAQGFARFPALAAPKPEPVTTSYLNARSAWRYWDKDSRPTDWHTRLFDDLAWPSGLAQLGYGDGDEATVINGGSATQRYITAYFRTTFTVDTIPDLLELELLADDGAVVYLNGVEVVRDNMVEEGPIGHSTTALTVRSGGPENALRPFSIAPSRLRVGSNVLAVEVHQSGPTSDDLGVDAELVGVFTD